MIRASMALLCAAAAAYAPFAAAAPRAVNSRPGLETVEGGMWADADKAERAAFASADVNHDARLNAYVRGVACKVAAEYCPELRVAIMDRPFFNATVMPNGFTEVWSGLLLRVETEDQLAYVLGHEIAHFVENHGLRSHQALQSRMQGAMAIGLLVGAAGVAVGVQSGTQAGMNDAINLASSINDLVYYGAVASYFGHSRESEMEADALGYGRAVAQGYSPTAPAQVWRNVGAEPATSDFARLRKESGRAGLFDSHPVSAERVAALDKLAGDVKRPGGDPHAYRAVIRPFLAAWLKDDLRRRDAGQTLHLIARLSLPGEDLGVLNFYKGEAYRLRRGEGDLAKARDAYKAAALHSDCPAEAWRNLGDVALKVGEMVEARAAYKTYLSRAPDAADRWLVEASLKKAVGAPQ